VLNDLRFTIRSLRMSSGFTTIAVLTLALGIGANTAIFSVVNAVLIRSLPYSHPERVVRILGHYISGRKDRTTISLPNFVDWRAQSTAFSAMSLYDEWQPLFDGPNGAERINGASVSAAFFDVLGVRPVAGRFFVPAEEPAGSARSLVLSYGFWVRQFGADPGTIGRTITLTGIPYTVVGVAPRGFEDPDLSDDVSAPQVWRSPPAYFNPTQSSRNGRAFTAIARLEPGVTQAAAASQMDGIMARLRAAYPVDNADRAVSLESLKDVIVAPVRPALLLLTVGVALVLLIACANVATLSLGRAVARTREFAVRRALGGSPGRLLAQLLVESLVLSVGGAACGLVLAVGATPALLRLGARALPRGDAIGVDGRVLAFTLAIAVLATFIFGLAPAVYAMRRPPAEGLGADSRGQTAGRHQASIRGTLVGVEVALAVVLLAGAGLLVRSLWRLTQTDAGFEPSGVLTMSLSPLGASYPDSARVSALYRTIDSRLAALPGVSAVGAIDILPMSDNFDGQTVTPLDRPPAQPGQELSPELRVATPGYFHAMGITTLRGRVLGERDTPDAPAVVVINETMARTYWPGVNPIGRRVRVGGARDAEIVGIVDDVRQFDLARAAEPEIYYPQAQVSWRFRTVGMTVAVKTASDPTSIAAAARAAVREVDPTIAVSDVQAMQHLVDATTRDPRFRTTLLMVFASVALTLGAIGIFGVVGYGVTRRRRELGIRLAFGARPTDVRRLVIRQGMRAVLAGLAIGLGGCLIATRLLQRFLYDVSPLDPGTFVAVMLGMLGVAILAAYLPARRATRVDPMEALRYE
jgi:predicted permease